LILEDLSSTRARHNRKCDGYAKNSNVPRVNKARRRSRGETNRVVHNRHIGAQLKNRATKGRVERELYQEIVLRILEKAGIPEIGTAPLKYLIPNPRRLQKLRESWPLKAGPPNPIAFWAQARTSYTARDIMTTGNRAPAFALCRERAIGVDRQSNPRICVLANRTRMRVSNALSAHIEIGDEIAFPIPLGDEIGGEVYITKEALSSGHSHDLYQAPIGNSG
jgi:hypothetical protein